MSNFEKRRKKLRKLLKREKVDSILITNFVNVTYLTGFTGDDSYLLLSDAGETILSDPRYTTQLEEECSDIDLNIREPGASMIEATSKLIKKTGAKRIGIEASSMTVGLREAITKELASGELINTLGLVEELRAVKDKGEIDRIRLACFQAEKAFEVAKAMITPETTEKEIEAELEYQARRFGGKGLSFSPIVGVGERAALPHGRATHKKIKDAPFVLIDWGVNEGLYVSDLTRVVVTGKLPAKMEKIYEIVLEAQTKAIEAICPGAECKAIDKIARDIITKAGFGKEFGHGLGHGLGLEVHDPSPRLSNTSKTILEPGMVVTVEPGIYIAGYGGVRIEDDILVTNSGYEVLTNCPKELADCSIA